jgi:hypothetical protein
MAISELEKKQAQKKEFIKKVKEDVSKKPSKPNPVKEKFKKQCTVVDEPVTTVSVPKTRGRPAKNASN